MSGQQGDSGFGSIQTSRLILRRFRPGDAATFYDYRSDPDVSRYQGWKPRSVEEVEAFIEKVSVLHPNTPGTWFQVAVCRRDSGELIGDCGMRFPADDDTQAEIGFTIAPAHQGRGYATEAVTAVLEYLFGVLKKHRVYGSVDPRNTRSIALLTRIGMREEAHFVKSIVMNGEWADDVIYAILDEEWPLHNVMRGARLETEYAPQR
ncbi:MAG: GNAT family N-acetyltransferase [Bacillota bacterium]